MQEQPPPLRSRSGARGFWTALCGLTLFVVLAVVSFYAEEDWRGARAFAAVRNGLNAKGETLDWHRFIPPPIPDEQNLATAPFFVRALNYQTNPKTHAYTFGPSGTGNRSVDSYPYTFAKPREVKAASYELARRTDLTGYQSFFRREAGFPHPAQPGNTAADVLLGLTRFGPALDEVSRAVAERPATRFPVDWNREEFWTVGLPQYNVEQQLVGTFGLRASALLAAGQPDEAWRDLAVCLRLSHDMNADHLLISHLVEIVSLQVVLNRVWEGLADRRWSAERLGEVQANLQGFDLLKGYADAMRFERATNVLNIDYLKRHRDVKMIDAMVTTREDAQVSATRKTALWVLPGGWFDQTSALTCRFEQDYAIDAMDLKGHRYLPALPAKGERELAGMSPVWLPALFEKIAFPVFKSVGLKAARAQAHVDEAVTACALERFFLDHHTYPARLDELVPAYLAHVPTDVIDGAPLRYRRTPDGRFQLYAVGWNGRDDGGTVAWGKTGALDPGQGDWVWQYTEQVPPGK